MAVRAAPSIGAGDTASNLDKSVVFGVTSPSAGDLRDCAREAFVLHSIRDPVKLSEQLSRRLLRSPSPVLGTQSTAREAALVWMDLVRNAAQAARAVELSQGCKRPRKDVDSG